MNGRLSALQIRIADGQRGNTILTAEPDGRPFDGGVGPENRILAAHRGAISAMNGPAGLKRGIMGDGTVGQDRC